MRDTWVRWKASAGIKNISYLCMFFANSPFQVLQGAATEPPLRFLSLREFMHSDLVASPTCQFSNQDWAHKYCSLGFLRCHSGFPGLQIRSFCRVTWWQTRHVEFRISGEFMILKHDVVHCSLGFLWCSSDFPAGHEIRWKITRCKLGAKDSIRICWEIVSWCKCRIREVVCDRLYIYIYIYRACLIIYLLYIIIIYTI